MKYRKIGFLAFALTVLLSACGGSSDGGETKPITTPPVTSTPDPTITLAKIGDCDTNVECSAYSITGKNIPTSSFISAATLEISNVQTAYIIGDNGQKTEISGNSVDVSGMNSKNFKIHVIHDTPGTMNFSVTNFTVSGTTYNYDGVSVSVTFTEAVIVKKTNFSVPLINFMSTNTKVSSDTDFQQVIKGELVPVLNFSNLTEHLSKYDDTTETFEYYSESLVTVVEGRIPDRALPNGYYVYKMTGDTDTAGINLTSETSRFFTIRDNNSVITYLGLYYSNLSKEKIDALNKYDDSFNVGDSKNITPSDIMVKDMVMIIAKQNGDTVSSIKSALMEYDIISLSNGMRYYSLRILPNQLSDFSVQLGDGPVMTQTIEENIAYNFQIKQDLEIGTTKLKITISNVEYNNGLTLIYTIDSSVGPISGPGGSITPVTRSEVIILE